MKLLNQRWISSVCMCVCVCVTSKSHYNLSSFVAETNTHADHYEMKWLRQDTPSEARQPKHRQMYTHTNRHSNRQTDRQTHVNDTFTSNHDSAKYRSRTRTWTQNAWLANLAVFHEWQFLDSLFEATYPIILHSHWRHIGTRLLHHYVIDWHQHWLIVNEISEPAIIVVLSTTHNTHNMSDTQPTL